MKKLMTLMLGLSFLVGTASLFAQDKTDSGKTKATKKAKTKKPKKTAGDTDKK
jgi:hypothetical protein